MLTDYGHRLIFCSVNMATKRTFLITGLYQMSELTVYMINTFHFIRILNQLRVFVTRSRHKCSIGLNRLRVIWDFNNQTNTVSSVISGLIGVIISRLREDWLVY